MSFTAAKFHGCPLCGGTLLQVIFGMPDPELWEMEQRGEVIIGGCIVNDFGPVGGVAVECVQGDWSGYCVKGKPVPPTLEETEWMLNNMRWKWELRSSTLYDFMEVADFLEEAQRLGNDHAPRVIGMPALEALRARFGINNDAFHNIGWYVGEMLYLNNDPTGIPLLKELEQVLAEQEHPANEVRIDTLEQLGWLARIANKPRLSYQAYRERHDQLLAVSGADDPDVIAARQLVHTAAEAAGFHRIAQEFSTTTM